MFFLLLLLLIITVSMLFQRKKDLNKYLPALIFFYFVSLFSMVLYISKDTYYYNLVKDYFYLPSYTWHSLFFLKISKENVIRLMNIGSTGILILSTWFALSYQAVRSGLLPRVLRISVWVYGALLLAVYEPLVNLKAYYALYPRFLSVEQYRHLENAIYGFTRSVNILIVLVNLLLLVFAMFTAPKLKLFKFHHLFLSVSYATLAFVYAYFISATPAFYLKISKIAGTYSFRSIPLGRHPSVYKLFPYVVIPMIVLITYSAVRLNRLNTQAEQEELYISKEISSSETTSKIFCHYIKNEILAIQSEIEMLPQTPETREPLENLSRRCDALYGRIDEIHRSTKTGELSLQLYPLEDLTEQVLGSFAPELESVRVVRDYPKHTVNAFLDPVYMEQALHNIVRNSLDAMESCPEKKLSVRLALSGRFIELCIADSGKGISKENLDKIFLPFYSSHSYSRHWGIGLTLTYKVIRAHEGKLTVLSEPGKGTAMSILLPRL